MTSAVGRRLRDEATALVPLLRQHAADGERLGLVPEPTLQALNRLGLLRLTLPTEMGGHALGIRDVVDITAEVARGDGSAAWMIFVSAGVRNLLAFPDEAVREVFADVDRWVGPLAAGASVFSSSLTGTARVVPGGYRVSGTWHYGSGSRHVAWICAGVEVVDAAGVPCGRGMLLLRQGQYEILDNWQVMGMRGTCSNSIRVAEEVFVPQHRYLDMSVLPARMDALRGRYEGLAYRTDARGLMLVVNLIHMSIVLGMAQGALECFLEQTPKLKPFNLPYPSAADIPSTQVVAAKGNAMVQTARTLIHRAAETVDRAALAGREIGAAEEAELMMLSVYGANLCDEAVGLLQRCEGSATAGAWNPVQRFVRDIRVALLHGATRLDPTAEIHGRHLLGRPPFTMFAGGLPDVGGKAPPPPLR